MLCKKAAARANFLGAAVGGAIRDIKSTAECVLGAALEPLCSRCYRVAAPAALAAGSRCSTVQSAPSCRMLCSLPAERRQPGNDGLRLQDGVQAPAVNKQERQQKGTATKGRIQRRSSLSSSSSDVSSSRLSSSDASSSDVSSSSEGGLLKVSPSAMATAAALMARYPEGFSAEAEPRLAEVAVSVLANLHAAGASRSDVESLLSNRPRLVDLQKQQRTWPYLERLFGRASAANLLARRPSLLDTTPATMARALAALALCGVPNPIELARLSPVLLQYRHEAPSLVAARLALQRYLGLEGGPAEAYRRFPTYLLASGHLVASRLQFLTDQGLMHRLVEHRARGRPRGSTADAAWATRGSRSHSHAVHAVPPLLTLSDVVKRSAGEFCGWACMPLAQFQCFEARFNNHPTWQSLHAASQQQAAQLKQQLQQLELQAAGEAAAATAGAAVV